MPDVIPEMALSETIEGRLLEATVARIQALNLPGISPSRVVIQKLAWLGEPSTPDTPCVVVVPLPETTSWQEGTNEKDRPQFAMLVAIVLANARDVTTRGMGLQLYWRQQLRQSFQNLSQGRFTDLKADALATDFGANYCGCSVDSGDKFIEAAKRDQRDAQYFVIRHKVKEGRQ